jgi:phytanoyl-CoA hydroxylase
MPTVRSSPNAQIAELRTQGYLVVPGFLSPESVEVLNTVASAQLTGRVPPLELEADLQYPGAPAARSSAGGETVRRLLNAYDRHPEFARHALAASLRRWMGAYFGESVRLSRAHHNCLMTKHPQFGSLTGWHRDIRYWSFEREDLLSVWMALGEERIDNGALWFVPGSQRMAFDESRFDAAKFFRADTPDNVELIKTAKSPHLAPGDAVLFHCNTLHSAGRNQSDRVKMSLVYSYHGTSNRPLPGTRSSAKPEVELPAEI